MTIAEKIKFHFDTRKFARITRQVAEDSSKISSGYIVDCSNDFIVLQESDDFRVLGYQALPVSQITDIRFNNHDKFYDKIMAREGEIDKVGYDHKVDLTNWQTIFRSLKKIGLNVIVECENPDIGTFTIGPVNKATKKSVYILYFNAAAFIDSKPTPIDYEYITKVMFDDRYINVFSKYLRHKKSTK